MRTSLALTLFAYLHASTDHARALPEERQLSHFDEGLKAMGDRSRSRWAREQRIRSQHNLKSFETSQLLRVRLAAAQRCVPENLAT